MRRRFSASALRSATRLPPRVPEAACPCRTLIEVADCRCRGCCCCRRTHFKLCFLTCVIFVSCVSTEAQVRTNSVFSRAFTIPHRCTASTRRRATTFGNAFVNYADRLGLLTSRSAFGCEVHAQHCPWPAKGRGGLARKRANYTVRTPAELRLTLHALLFVQRHRRFCPVMCIAEEQCRKYSLYFMLSAVRF